MEKNNISKKAVYLSLAIISLLLISILTGIFVQNTIEKKTQPKNQILFDSSIKNNGFHIYQFQDNTWKKQYQANFPIHYETHTFPIQTESNELKITIIHIGPNFADIEEISLTANGVLLKPQSAYFTETRESIISEISQKDLNVVVAHEQPIEITWNVPKEKQSKLMLSINANEYGWFGKPFFFQDGTYTLGSKIKQIQIDGILDENLGLPTHKIFWEPASGHPDGYTYFYVTEDNNNLYFSIDITCDNSNEFGDDWAEIGINDYLFRIDDYHQQWGTLGFGYTDKVDYKHQTAEFCIPKSYCPSDTIAFTFRYYGTAITEDGSIIDIDLGEQNIYPNQVKTVQHIQVKDHGADGGALSIDYFTIFNDGTASNSQIGRISLWRDHGDGAFDAGNGDDTLVGSPVINPDLTTGVVIGGKGDGNIVNIANGRTYEFWIAIDLHPNAEEHGHTIRTKINGTLSSTSYSNWKPYWKSGFEYATSNTTIDASPTGNVTVDTSYVSDVDLEFKVSILYDEEMNTLVIPLIQFTGNTGALSVISGGWVNSFLYERTYEITDVNEEHIVMVESSQGKDTSGNQEGPCIPANFTVDTIQPTIDSITGDTTGTTGESTTVETTFSDNIEVTTATLHYRIDGGAWKTTSILTGEADISIPSDTTDTWFYYVDVEDIAGNPKRDPTSPGLYEITITDNDAPLLSDNSPGSAVAGQSYIFYASSIDNIDPSPFVYVEYWFNTDSHQNKSMIPASGNYFEYQITIPTNAETLHYVIASKDSLPNWRSTSTVTIPVDNEQGESTDVIYPIAQPGGPYQSSVETEITFDGSQSTDPDGTITNYSWTFGDGTNGYKETPTHIYTSPGTFTITLIVTDNDGLTHLNTTLASITSINDTDDDGYSDDMEQSYGTNTSDKDDFPLDTDGDGIPDQDSTDGNYTGDTDDDDDGLIDVEEQMLGSDSKNSADVTELTNIDGYLIDTDDDGQKDTFYNPTTQIETPLELFGNNTLGIDVDDDALIDYIYDPGTNETDPYTQKDSAKAEPFPTTIILIVIVILIIIIAGVLYYIKKK